jgi:hypothetical protein
MTTPENVTPSSESKTQETSTSKTRKIEFGKILGDLSTPWSHEKTARRSRILIRRAQRVFLLWVAIHFHNPSEPSNIGLFLDQEVYFQAKLFALMSILNHSYKNGAERKLRFVAALKDPIFKAGLESLLKMDGLSRLRLLPQRRDFADHLKKLSREAGDVSKIIEFSLRINFQELGDKSRPGITCTTECIGVCRDSEDKDIIDFWGGRPPARATLFDKWNLYERSSIFHWMIGKGYFPKLPRLGSKDFPTFLLQSAENHEAWAQVCGNYRFLSDELRRRHYSGIPELQVSPSVSLPSPTVAPFQELPGSLREVVRNYSRFGRKKEKSTR